MSDQRVWRREAWYRYIRLNNEEQEKFRNMLGLSKDDDLKDHNDPDHPFQLDIGGEGYSHSHAKPFNFNYTYNV